MRPRQFAAIFALLAAYGPSFAQDKPTDPKPSTPGAALETPVKTVPGDAVQPDAATILKRADMACRSLKSVRYSLKTERPGAAGSQRNRTEGDVLLMGWKGDQPGRYRYDFRTYPSGKDEAQEVVIGFDGDLYYLIDRNAKKVFVGADSATLGTYRITVRFVPIVEFVRPNPFEDEIAGRKIEYRGSAKSGDEDCETVYVAYASAAQEAIWYFSKKDYLPRQIDRKFRSPDGATIDQQWILSNVKQDPKVNEEAFKLQVPEGYTRIDGPAK